MPFTKVKKRKQKQQWYKSKQEQIREASRNLYEGSHDKCKEGFIAITKPILEKLKKIQGCIQVQSRKG